MMEFINVSGAPIKGRTINVQDNVQACHLRSNNLLLTRNLYFDKLSNFINVSFLYTFKYRLRKIESKKIQASIIYDIHING